MCCTGSTAVFSRAACKEISKIGLELKILRSEVHLLRLKQLNSYKYYCKFTLVPDLFTSRRSNYHVVKKKNRIELFTVAELFGAKYFQAVWVVAGSNVLRHF